MGPATKGEQAPFQKRRIAGPSARNPLLARRLLRRAFSGRWSCRAVRNVLRPSGLIQGRPGRHPLCLPKRRFETTGPLHSARCLLGTFRTGPARRDPAKQSGRLPSHSSKLTKARHEPSLPGLFLAMAIKVHRIHFCEAEQGGTSGLEPTSANRKAWWPHLTRKADR